MHDTLHQWAKDWSLSPYAVLDLLQRLGVGYEMPGNAAHEGFSETAVSQRLAIAAAQQGILSWRNNLGAMQDASGRMVRFGLCNDTAALNKKFKSSDRVGIKPVLIGPEHVGTTIGQAWFREVKEYDKNAGLR